MFGSDESYPGFNTIVINSGNKNKHLLSKRMGPFKIIEKTTIGYEDLVNTETAVRLSNGNVELFVVNLYQWASFSKVYGSDYKSDKITKKFFDNREKGFTNEKALKTSKSDYIGVYANGKLMNKQEGLRYYIYLYYKLLKENELYQAIKEQVDRGVNTYISSKYGPDLGLINKEKILELYNTNSSVFTDELIIAAILADALPEEFYIY